MPSPSPSLRDPGYFKPLISPINSSFPSPGPVGPPHTHSSLELDSSLMGLSNSHSQFSLRSRSFPTPKNSESLDLETMNSLSSSSTSLSSEPSTSSQLLMGRLSPHLDRTSHIDNGPGRWHVGPVSMAGVQGLTLSIIDDQQLTLNAAQQTAEAVTGSVLVDQSPPLVGSSLSGLTSKSAPPSSSSNLRHYLTV